MEEKIKKASYLMSTISYAPFPLNFKEYIFCGRSNVGKSSLINVLTNHKNLARTSSTPGKTRTLNLYQINDDILFVDVPGYGYAKVSKKQMDEFSYMIDDYFSNTKNLKSAFLLVDFRHKPTEQDVKMYDYLKYYNIKTYVIATKVDKVKNSEKKKQLALITNTLNLDHNLILTSAEKRSGLEEIYKILLD